MTIKYPTTKVLTTKVKMIIKIMSIIFFFHFSFVLQLSKNIPGGRSGGKVTIHAIHLAFIFCMRFTELNQTFSLP